MPRDRETYNAHMREYMLRRYQQRRNHAVATLGGRCSRCGNTDDLHVDRDHDAQAAIRIDRIYNASWGTFVAELDKCFLLCGPCHRDHMSEREKRRRPATHGKYWRAFKYKCQCEPCSVFRRNYNKGRASQRRLETKLKNQASGC